MFGCVYASLSYSAHLSYKAHASYGVRDLRVLINSASQRLFLNDRGTVFGKGMKIPTEMDEQERVFMFMNGKMTYFPGSGLRQSAQTGRDARAPVADDVLDVGGLNDRNLALLQLKSGTVLWNRGKETPVGKNWHGSGFFPWLGTPMGIDDAGRTVFVAQGADGVFEVHFWPPRRPPTARQDLTSHQGGMGLSGFVNLPRPTAVAGDGSFCGVFGQGMMPGRATGPTAFLYDGSQVLPIVGGDNFLAPTALSRTHYVAGWSRYDGGYRKAFVWRDGMLSWLPGRSGEQMDTFANGVNSAGEVVGGTDWVEHTGNDFLYRRCAALWKDGELLDLNDLVPKDCPFDLVSAEAINDRGQILVRASPKTPSPWYQTLLLLTPEKAQKVR